MSKKYYVIILCFIFILSGVIKAQDKEKVGANQITNQQGGLYNFGDKDKVNIEVSVWGYVKFPGKYIIPKGSTLVDLISYTGGPNVDAKLDDVRLLRSKNDTLNLTKDEIIRLNLNDLFWEKNISNKNNRNIVIVPGDVLIFPGEPRYFFRENLTYILSIASTLISVAILIFTVSKK